MGHVNGWAFAPEEVQAEYKKDYLEALERVGIAAKLRPGETRFDAANLSEATRRRVLDLRLDTRNGYASFTVVLDPVAVKGLTDRQKVLLADCGNACFGGRVEGNQVTVYTD